MTNKDFDKFVYNRLVAFQDNLWHETDGIWLNRVRRELCLLPQDRRDEIVSIMWDNKDAGGLFLTGHILLTLNGGKNMPTQFKCAYNNPIACALDMFCWRTDEVKEDWLNRLLAPHTMADVAQLSANRTKEDLTRLSREVLTVHRCLNRTLTPKQQPTVEEKRVLEELAYDLRYAPILVRKELLDFVQQNREKGADILEPKISTVLIGIPETIQITCEELKKSCEILTRLPNKEMALWGQCVLAPETASECICKAISRNWNRLFQQKNVLERN